MAHFTAKFPPRGDVLDRAASAYALDADFAVMCAALTAAPKYGYADIEARVDASGHIEGFAPAVRVCECVSDE